MAMIDYGALLRVDGKLVNNEMFMDASDTGYVCEKAYYPKYDEDININGNYFVYAGDEELLLCFYKCQCLVISNNKVITGIWSVPFASETFFLPNNVNLKISHLDKELKIEPLLKSTNFEDFMREEYSDHYLESISEYKLKNERKWFKKMVKKSHTNKNICYKYRTNRYLAEWDYKGKHYEVIFGYGIDADKEVFGDIKHLYDFTDTERKIIDEWFE